MDERGSRSRARGVVDVLAVSESHIALSTSHGA